MESEKYLEGQSMQRPPLFESDGFLYFIKASKISGFGRVGGISC